MGLNENHTLIIEENEPESMKIDPGRSRFPYCIVWSPLPIISWFFPCIGHIGICRADGVILDFAGPNFVCVDSFAFGAPTRYIQLTKEQCCAFYNFPAHDSDDDDTSRNADKSEITNWDEALMRSTQEYQHKSYNILTCNCHSFVANSLNRLKFRDRDWNVVKLAVFIFIKGQYVSKLGVVRTYLPFAIVSAIGVALGGVSYFSYLAGFVCVLVGWFLICTYCFRNVIDV